jgi:hypothetical protein
MSSTAAHKSTNKTILVAGLGRFITSIDPEGAAQLGDNRQLLLDNLSKARSHGFDPSPLEVNPNDAANSLEDLRELLQSKQWDGFIIGYGIRGKKEFTDLFEDLVNLSREVSPTTKLGFSVAPDAVFETMRRMFPEVDGMQE